ncbi:MAG TPA: hypothetical protein VI248_00935 [Kineosporiaceae bacterium]
MGVVASATLTELDVATVLLIVLDVVAVAVVVLGAAMEVVACEKDVVAT